MRKTYLEVDLDIFKENINKIKEFVKNKEIMAVIKANAYGTYINKRLDIVNMFNVVAVALIDEAIELRKLGYNKEIFVLNQPDIHELDLIKEYDITIGLSDELFLDEMLKINKEYKVHLEIETGMNRTGININNLQRYLDKIKNSKVVIEGIYSHLSSADFDKEYTEKQITTFKKAIEIVKDNNIDPKYIHISASNGILNYELLDFTNMVRPGIIMYGYESFKGSRKTIDTKPICKLKSVISFIKEVKKGEAISYSQKYICEEDKIIATIPIGYGDGFRRALTNKGYILVNNVKCPIVGAVCMDNCMIDITNVEKAKIGDEVIIFDNKNIKLEDISDICETINYEILCNINCRVPRLFIENK